MNDEAFERELFAVRARAMPAYRLDLGDVLARARRVVRAPRPRPQWLAWLGSAACAAAAMLAVPASGGVAEAPAPAGACYSPAPPREDAVCEMPARDLVCDVTLASSEP